MFGRKVLPPSGLMILATVSVLGVSDFAQGQSNPAAGVASPGKRPNVIMILTDDQGYGDLSCHGNPTLKTEHLDRLHSESIRFTDFHVAPFCTPTRAALMTGRYPARTGAYRTSSGRTSLHGREKTLGDLFTRNGYATGVFGKWHLGDCAPSRPMDKGFERSVWHRCGGLTQISDYWTNDYFDDTYLVGSRQKKFEGYCTDVWFDEAMTFMSSVAADAGGSKPFFVYLPTNAPHGPLLVAEKWKQPFLDQGIKPNIAAFKGMVSNLDWNVGRLLDFLDDEKLADDTIVMFMTDNGTGHGAQFDKRTRIYGWPVVPVENAGMRGGKSSAYEGGHRVPLFIRLPKRQQTPRDVEQLAAHIDITPTLVDLCDLERPADWPSLDGQSLAPLLDGNAVGWPSRTIHTQMHGGNGFRKPGDPWEIGAVLTDRWRLVGGRELYDIKVDPAQKNDVAKQHPDVVAQLRKSHLAWFEDVRTGMVPTRIVIGSDVENPTPLTSQEWVVSPGNPPWAHSHVVKRMRANGEWHLDVATAGKYEFSLARWPHYLNKSLESVAAAIQISGRTMQQEIDDAEVTAAKFIVDLPAGPTELKTTLTPPKGKTHGAYFVNVRKLTSEDEDGIGILWTQYGLSRGTLKLAAHTTASPLKPETATASLEVFRQKEWQRISTVDVDSLTAMAEFRIENWDAKASVKYRVICGESQWEGTIRPEPAADATFNLMAVACVNDKWFPYSEAVDQMIEQDPDLVFFAGDQIYESNAGGEVIMAETAADVPLAMANYLAKWRKFGLTFKHLLKDRPSIMITDDHDVYANDLWGNGGLRMTGDRTEGGYPTEVAWVNAVERTQTWHLPDAAAPGPWGDGVFAYYTSLEYGGVSFAILEDRKFKSPPSEVVKEAIADPRTDTPNRTPEVIMDPAFDVSKLDRPDLHLLGEHQEEFVAEWAQASAKRNLLSVVLSQSPLVNIGNYDTTYGDMDSNAWPQSARNRALKAIAPSRAVMISGDIHFGTLHQHGIENWGDGPWGYSLPAFASKPNRRWSPSVAAQGREIPDIAGSGNHHDRFGNKLTVAGTANGLNGYGTIVFDKGRRTITMKIHTMDGDRKPINQPVSGWPLVIPVP